MRGGIRRRASGAGLQPFHGRDPGGSIRGVPCVNRALPERRGLRRSRRVRCGGRNEVRRRGMSNLGARDSLERAKRLFLQRPGPRESRTRGDVVWREGLSARCRAPRRARDHRHAGAHGGTAAGCGTGWLLRAGTASCAAARDCDARAVPGTALNTLQVKVESEIRCSRPCRHPHVSTGPLRNCACR